MSENHSERLIQMFKEKSFHFPSIAFSKHQFSHQISFTPYSRLSYRIDQKPRPAHLYSRIEHRATVSQIERLFSSQDLHLDAYRRIFFCYHPKTDRVFSVRTPFSAIGVFRKTTKEESDKTISTIELRKKRIKLSSQ